MIVEYSANNSGGRWWLADKDWLALEQAGWRIEWGGNYRCGSTYSFSKPPEGAPQPCADVNTCEGHRKYETSEQAALNRYMGALARAATLECETPAAAMRSFEAATGQDVSDEGCNCCGAPHLFTWGGNGTGIKYDCASGAGCLAYMFPGQQIPTVREAMEAARTAAPDGAEVSGDGE